MTTWHKRLAAILRAGAALGSVTGRRGLSIRFGLESQCLRQGFSLSELDDRVDLDLAERPACQWTRRIYLVW
jgi:hypothetical protein